MKKIKLLSSFLGLGLVAGAITPIVASCNQNHEEEPVRKQCHVSLDDDCADQFTLGVSKIPEGHTLLTTIVATDRYWCSREDKPTIRIKVGEDVLLKDDYALSNSSLNTFGYYYWTLAIYSEHVTDDITISINTDDFQYLFPIKIQIQNRISWFNAWASPILRDDVEDDTTFEVTIHCTDEYYIMPESIQATSLFSSTETLSFDSSLTLDSGEPFTWNFAKNGSTSWNWFTKEMKLYIQLTEIEYFLAEEFTLTINCNLVEPSRLPNNIYNGIDTDTEETLVEGEDFQTNGSLNDEYLEVELIGEAADNKNINEESISFDLDYWCEEGVHYGRDFDSSKKKFRIVFNPTGNFYIELFSHITIFERENDINIGFQIENS